MCHNNLGNLLMNEQARFEEACKEFVTALLLRPDYGDAESNLGLIYLHANRPADAATAFAEATRMDPTLSGQYQNLGIALLGVPG